ncbi:RidA family protein [Nocardia ignorata]|uniref:Enamine deaminase RidA (YjgF/YER057c/UK114 family) n=1 Tax=Nocardia ignorata TaxID=145285 RepID=A0A4R6P0Z6_NOCIG|nr:RidA family protein [Nocardia ignorata]TDP31101.1 enamine deaminase RidA (YjgF/YER057c/UK114 family) [Nocardia ignorata]
MQRQLINPPGTEATYDRLHFSQAVRAGNLIWVSGQVGIDRSTGAPAEGMDAQARIAFEGVRTVLEAAGASMSDIVELMTFHTDMRTDIEEFVKVKDEYLPADFPAWTGVGVSQLARDGLLVEVRVVAAVSD